MERKNVEPVVLGTENGLTSHPKCRTTNKRKRKPEGISRLGTMGRGQLGKALIKRQDSQNAKKKAKGGMVAHPREHSYPGNGSATGITVKKVLASIISEMGFTSVWVGS